MKELPHCNSLIAYVYMPILGQLVSLYLIWSSGEVKRRDVDAYYFSTEQ
jgi:hypothetical protein